MSLILEALKKADENRPDDLAAKIPQPELPPSYRPQPKPFPWLIAGSVALTVIIILSSSWYFLAGDPASHAQTLPHQPQSNSANTLGTEPRVSNATRTPSASISATESQASQPKLRTTTAANTTDKNAIGALYETPNKPAMPSEIDSLYSKANTEKTTPPTSATGVSTSTVAAKKVETTTPTAPASKPKATVETNEVEKLADFIAVKNIRDLPSTIQDAIPTLMYTDHIYANTHLDIIMLNRMPLRNGDISPEGVRVEKIVEDGALLVYKGQRFKIYALNSWVNL